ncbi:cytochrome c oxidase subunit II [Parafilimonas sp.]|uniref:cytochrome c oxidase subunit II n=1 Tax=Parafilimonas sp. TaxID=1969739 RepID=UPI0039E53475
MSMFFTIAVIVLVFLIIFQIAKASEYVSVIKGEARARKEQNKVNGFLMIAFLIAGLIGVYLCNKALFPKTLLAHEAASVQGEKVDTMLWMTLIITGTVFFITQILLFWFNFKYQESDKRKSYYFTHSNKLELLWTAVPAIAMTGLVVFGLKNWYSFTGPAPKEALQVEITGKQFGWIFRYPGIDKTFGKKYYKLIDDANSNSLGQDWKDSKNFDDVVVSQTMYCVKNKPVQLVIYSRDVIHDVGLSEFRLKQDAVPGTPTTLWFTPKFTTKEMKEKLGNPDFQYEISCDQMCGNGHYSMKGVIEVVTQEEYDVWLAQQKPNYFAAFPDKDPSSQKPQLPAADSTKTTASVKAEAVKTKM